jgi:nucleotide-binding universal stress UspA family protein
MKTILLATDGSHSAESAASEAIALSQATGAVLHIVTAWSIPRSAFAYDALGALAQEMSEVERERGEKALAAAVAVAKAAGLEPRPVLRHGDAGEVICAVADEIGADLIVVGSHGWNPVRRLFLGSVSARVLHHAPCPVLVVRGEPQLAAGEDEALVG